MIEFWRVAHASQMRWKPSDMYPSTTYQVGAMNENELSQVQPWRSQWRKPRVSRERQLVPIKGLMDTDDGPIVNWVMNSWMASYFQQIAIITRADGEHGFYMEQCIWGMFVDAEERQCYDMIDMDSINWRELA